MLINPEVVKPKKVFGANQKRRGHGLKTSTAEITPSVPALKQTLGAQEKRERAAHRKKVLANKFSDARKS
jgi:hypothetical protein